MTIASRLKAEGRAEGRAEGKAEGKTQELREKLLRVIELRFGPPAADLKDRLGSAEPALLEAWFDRAVTASRLESVFEEA